jgi:hypothetical protein
MDFGFIFKDQLRKIAERDCGIYNALIRFSRPSR